MIESSGVSRHSISDNFVNSIHDPILQTRLIALGYEIISLTLTFITTIGSLGVKIFDNSS